MKCPPHTVISFTNWLLRIQVYTRRCLVHTELCRNWRTLRGHSTSPPTHKDKVQNGHTLTSSTEYKDSFFLDEGVSLNYQSEFVPCPGWRDDVTVGPDVPKPKTWIRQSLIQERLKGQKCSFCSQCLVEMSSGDNTWLMLPLTYFHSRSIIQVKRRQGTRLHHIHKP